MARGKLHLFWLLTPKGHPSIGIRRRCLCRLTRAMSQDRGTSIRPREGHRPGKLGFCGGLYYVQESDFTLRSRVWRNRCKREREVGNLWSVNEEGLKEME